MPNQSQQNRESVDSQIEYRQRLAAKRQPVRLRNFKPLSTGAEPPVKSPTPRKAVGPNQATVNALAEKLNKMERKAAVAELNQLTKDDPVMADAVRARLAILSKLRKAEGPVQTMPVAPTNMNDAVTSSRMTRPTG